MIPLIKIRLTFIKRNIWKCFFYYFLTGISLLIILIVILITGNISSDNFIDEEFDNYNINKYPEYNTLDNPIIGIISEDKKLFDEFKYYTHIPELQYYKNENQIKNYDLDFIEIIKLNKKSFQFKLKSDYLIFQKSIEDEKSKLMIPDDDNFINRDLSNYAFYIHNFLLQYNNITGKDFKIYSFTMKNKYNDFNTSQLYFIPFFISFIYGFFFLNISLRMIAEKENKIDILLNRYGIKRHQYYISWLLTYIILTSFTMICIIIFFYYISFISFFPFLFLFILNQILFSIGIFSMAFFTQTVVNTLKTGQTIFKLLFFGIGIYI